MLSVSKDIGQERYGHKLYSATIHLPWQLLSTLRSQLPLLTYSSTLLLTPIILNDSITSYPSLWCSSEEFCHVLDASKARLDASWRAAALANLFASLSRSKFQALLSAHGNHKACPRRPFLSGRQHVLPAPRPAKHRLQLAWATVAALATALAVVDLLASLFVFFRFVPFL